MQLIFLRFPRDLSFGVGFDFQSLCELQVQLTCAIRLFDNLVRPVE